MRKAEHYHTIGQYSEGSHFWNYMLGSDLGSRDKKEFYYKYCSECGAKLTPEVIAKQEAM